MGAAQSSPEDVLIVVNEPVNYTPPLEVNPANPLVYFDIQRSDATATRPSPVAS